MCGCARCLIEVVFTGRLPNANLFPLPLPCLLPRKKPTLWLPFILFLWMSSRLSICHSSRHFRPQNLLQLFQTTPSLIPDSAPPLKNTNTLSFTVQSRLNAAWLYHRQHFAKAPGWCEAAALPAPGSCKVLGQLQAHPGLKLSLQENKNKEKC